MPVLRLIVLTKLKMGNKIQIDKTDMLFRKVSLQDDEEAFRILFYDFFAPLCVFAHRYLEEMETCEDIVQETFYRIWKNRKDLDIQISARNFLITSVRNACLDLIRKQEIEKRWIEKRLEKDTEEEYEDLYTTQELESLLNQALNKLPEQIASTFRMNRFGGKTYVEIAEEKQISVKTVEAYMTRALKFLRIELKDYLPILLILYPHWLG